MAMSNADYLQVRGEQSVQGRTLAVHYLRSDKDFEVGPQSAVYGFSYYISTCEPRPHKMAPKV